MLTWHKLRAEKIFCNLPNAALQALESIKYTTAYPKGAVLFVEGQAPRGVFILCRGRVKLSICSSDGKTLILKIAGPGELLGLSACVTDKPYEATVETLSPCQVNFIRREDFLQLLHEDAEACLRRGLALVEKHPEGRERQHLAPQLGLNVQHVLPPEDYKRTRPVNICPGRETSQAGPDSRVRICSI